MKFNTTMAVTALLVVLLMTVNACKDSNRIGLQMKALYRMQAE